MMRQYFSFIAALNLQPHLESAATRRAQNQACWLHQRLKRLFVLLCFCFVIHYAQVGQAAANNQYHDNSDNVAIATPLLSPSPQQSMDYTLWSSSAVLLFSSFLLFFLGYQRLRHAVVQNSYRQKDSSESNICLKSSAAENTDNKQTGSPVSDCITGKTNVASKADPGTKDGLNTPTLQCESTGIASSSTPSWARAHSRCSDSTWAGYGRSSSCGSRSMQANGSPLLGSRSPPLLSRGSYTVVSPLATPLRREPGVSTHQHRDSCRDIRDALPAVSLGSNDQDRGTLRWNIQEDAVSHALKMMSTPEKRAVLHNANEPATVGSVDADHPNPRDASLKELVSSKISGESRSQFTSSNGSPAIADLEKDATTVASFRPNSLPQTLLFDTRAVSQLSNQRCAPPPFMEPANHPQSWSPKETKALNDKEPNRNEETNVNNNAEIPTHYKIPTENEPMSSTVDSLTQECLTSAVNVNETWITSALLEKFQNVPCDGPHHIPAMLHIADNTLHHGQCSQQYATTSEANYIDLVERTVESLLQKRRIFAACALLVVVRGDRLNASGQAQWLSILHHTVRHLLTDQDRGLYFYSSHDVITAVKILLGHLANGKRNLTHLYANEFLDHFCTYYGVRACPKNRENRIDSVVTASVLRDLLHIFVTCSFNTSFMHSAVRRLASSFVNATSSSDTSSHRSLLEQLTVLVNNKNSSSATSVEDQNALIAVIHILQKQEELSLPWRQRTSSRSSPEQQKEATGENESHSQCTGKGFIASDPIASPLSSPNWRKQNSGTIFSSKQSSSSLQSHSTAFSTTHLLNATGSPPISPDYHITGEEGQPTDAVVRKHESSPSSGTTSTQLPSPMDLSRTGSTSHLHSLFPLREENLTFRDGPSLVESKDMCFSIIQDCLRTADVKTAVLLFQALEQRLVDKMDSTEPQESTDWILEALDSVLKVFAFHDDLNHAKKAVHLLERYGRANSQSYELATTICCRLGELSQALEYVKRAVALESLSQDKSSVSTPSKQASPLIPILCEEAPSEKSPAVALPSDASPGVQLPISPPSAPSPSLSTTECLSRTLKCYTQCLLENGQYHEAIDFLQDHAYCLQTLVATVSQLLCKIVKAQPDHRVVRRVLHLVLPASSPSYRHNDRGALHRNEERSAPSSSSSQRWNVPLDDHLFAALVDACVRHKEEEMLLELTQKFRTVWSDTLSPDLQTCGILIKALGVRGRIDDCRWIFWHITERQKLQPSEVTYGCILDALVNNNRVSEAVALFEDIKKKGRIRPNTIMFSTIAKGYAQDKQLDNALRIHDEMKALGISINTVTYNTLVDACARVGAMDKAAGLLEDMLISGVEPDLITFSTIAKGYCVQGDVARAMQLLDAMQERGIRPDGILYNSLLDGCVRALRPDLCEELWQKMQSAGIPPSNFTLTILIKMFGRAGKLQRAFVAVQQLPKRYGFTINAHVYTCLMSACIANKEFTKALDVFYCMKKDGVIPDAKTYETALFGTIRSGQFHAALEIVRDAFQLDSKDAPASTAAAAPRFPSRGGGNSGKQRRNAQHVVPGLHMDPRNLRNLWAAMRDAGQFEDAALKTVTEIQNTYGAQACRYLPNQQQSHQGQQFDMRRRFTDHNSPTYTASSFHSRSAQDANGGSSRVSSVHNMFNNAQ